MFHVTIQLEELDEIFAQPNPRKASTQKKKLALDNNANIVDVVPVDVVGGQEVERPVGA
jgi:endonuclease/exonuclease/phosphatase family metal-dependent hydrolase